MIIIWMHMPVYDNYVSICTELQFKRVVHSVCLHQHLSWWLLFKSTPHTLSLATLPNSTTSPHLTTFMECLVDDCLKLYKGKSASSSLQRHIKASHKDSEYKLTERQLGVDPKATRQAINAWYKAKYPSRSLALIRMKQMKRLAEKGLEKDHLAQKPQRLPPPRLDTTIGEGNVYWKLEERYGIFVGRLERLFYWKDAAKVSILSPIRVNYGC